MTMELVAARLEAINAKLDLVLAKIDKLDAPRQASPSHADGMPPEVSAALTLHSRGLPREARIGMRTVAVARLQRGDDPSAVVTAIEKGEGTDSPAARSLMASV